MEIAAPGVKAAAAEATGARGVKAKAADRVVTVLAEIGVAIAIVVIAAAIVAVTGASTVLPKSTLKN